MNIRGKPYGINTVAEITFRLRRELTAARKEAFRHAPFSNPAISAAVSTQGET
jgi:hypothetical protein